MDDGWWEIHRLVDFLASEMQENTVEIRTKK